MMIGIDLETTGLALDSKIIEVAMVLVDENLRVLDCYTSYVYYEDPLTEVDFEPGAWALHQESGLLRQREEERQGILSSEGLELPTLAEVTRKMNWILDMWARKYSVNQAPLLGNSVHYDRAILQNQMPDFASRLHYRNVDVSSFVGMAKMWGHYDHLGIVKTANHHALTDILSSVETLKMLRERWIRKPWYIRLASWFRRP